MSALDPKRTSVEILKRKAAPSFCAIAAVEVNPWEVDFYNKTRQTWAEHGELIRLPENEQTELIESVRAAPA
jgi:hypothetical protein